MDDPAVAEGIDLGQTDEQLLAARFRQGEAFAFDEIVVRHQPQVTRLAYRLMGWRGEVEDVVQEVFLTALRRCRQFRGDSSLATWLAAITINTCRSWRRRRWLRLKWLRERQSLVDANQMAVAADRDSMRDETSARVRAAVQALPDRDREVIVLFYLEQKSVVEMGRILGAKPNAIDVRLHRARQKLKGTLADLME